VRCAFAFEDVQQLDVAPSPAQAGPAAALEVPQLLSSGRSTARRPRASVLLLWPPALRPSDALPASRRRQGSRTASEGLRNEW
jgi:hypothetical protein